MARLDQQRIPVCGIDALLPDRFVPVEGISYLGGGLQPAKLNGSALFAWSAIRGFKKGLVLLNGVWPNRRERYTEIQELTAHCHVVIADQITAPETQSLASTSSSAYFIMVAEQKNQISIGFADPPRSLQNRLRRRHS